MKKYLTNIGLVVFSVVFVVGTVYGHGGETGMGSSGGMTEMMKLMHGNIDRNSDLDCYEVSNEEMMERGEEIMEEMMGHEDHERIEEAMEKDMQDHDSMHMMMGMWSSGCIGAENMNTLMERYGLSQRIGDLGESGDDLDFDDWPSALIGIAIGVFGSWAGSRLLKKK